jgi:hypothetical protein
VEFFRDFDDEATDLGGPEPLRPAHLRTLLSDLDTDYLDELVVHRIGDAGPDSAQEELAGRGCAPVTSAASALGAPRRI